MGGVFPYEGPPRKKPNDVYFAWFGGFCMCLNVLFFFIVVDAKFSNFSTS